MKLLKTYLKPFAALVLACILLLFGQAMCDLTLPNLMSDIVNTGIQLGGVDEAAPAVLNQQAVDLLTLFMNDAEAGTFKNAYTPVEHGSDEETKLAKTYENIKDMDAAALSEDADVQAVGDAYGKAAYAFMTFLKDYGAQTGQAVDTESGVQDMDMRQLYAPLNSRLGLRQQNQMYHATVALVRFCFNPSAAHKVVYRLTHQRARNTHAPRNAPGRIDLCCGKAHDHTGFHRGKVFIRQHLAQLRMDDARDLR